MIVRWIAIVVVSGLLVAGADAIGNARSVEVRSLSAPTSEIAGQAATVSETSTTVLTPAAIDETAAKSRVTPARPEPPRTARLAFTGDLLPHGPVQRAGTLADRTGWDFTSMYDEVRPILESVDLAICHLETPISADDTNLGGYPTFSAPRAFAQAALDAGYQGCSLASNHSYDRGAQGVTDTLDVLDEIGLTAAGQARSEYEDRAPVLYEINDITIAHLSATYSLNGFALPPDRPYLVDLIEPDEILAEAGLARDAGADFVVVSLHWGAEYQSEPIQSQLDWLNAILPADEVDLVIGHHAHVVQPVDKVGDEWVVFGLGNFLSNQSADCCTAAAQDGMIATVELVETGTGSIEVSGIHYIPTWVDRSEGYVIRVAEPGRTDVSAPTAARLDASHARTVAVVGSRLGDADGLTVGHSAAPESAGQTSATPEIG